MKLKELNPSDHEARQGQSIKAKNPSPKHTDNSRAGIPMPAAVPLAGWEG